MDRWARGDLIVPAPQVRPVIEADAVCLVQVHVGVAGDIRDGVCARQIRIVGQPLIENAAHVAILFSVMFLGRRYVFGEAVQEQA